MTKKQRIITGVLWGIAAVLMLSGAIMLALGIRPGLDFFSGLIANMLTGDIPPVPSVSEFSLAIVGLIFLVVGAVLLYVAGALTKKYHRQSDNENTGERLRATMDRLLSAKERTTAPPAANANGFCARCGRPVEKADYHYCPYCGTMLVPLSALSEPMGDEQPLPKPLPDTFDEEDADDEDVPTVVLDDESVAQTEAAGQPADEDKDQTRSVTKTVMVTCKHCGSTYHMGEEVCLLCGHKLRNE